MKTIIFRRHGLACLTTLIGLALMGVARGNETNQPAMDQPAAILKIMERVADWQLANPSQHKSTDWTQAAGEAGIMVPGSPAGAHWSSCAPVAGPATFEPGCALSNCTQSSSVTATARLMFIASAQRSRRHGAQ